MGKGNQHAPVDSARAANQMLLQDCFQGFADASEKAFGAVIYLQSITRPGEYCSTNFFVAPIKTMTIPRLELLLSKLMQKVLEALKLKIDDVKLWSDSSIALAWINTSPHLLKNL
ncbi:uncharacterized protein LOC118200887, partial [Stegodyphus dumicola]|uniref:uncharacterized protein LOC118200887 n=1 Tax=Stegodyphus dumicola TaxID=202533 RepID=UPI0015A98C9F